jgi:hypothetical protein
VPIDSKVLIGKSRLAIASGPGENPAGVVFLPPGSQITSFFLPRCLMLGADGRSKPRMLRDGRAGHKRHYRTVLVRIGPRSTHPAAATSKRYRVSNEISVTI